MEQQLVYAAPAQDVRDIVSTYYFADFPREALPEGGIVAYERAAIAQIRFVFSGSAVVMPPGGARIFVDGPVVVGPTTGQTGYEIKEGVRLVGAGLLPCGWHAMTRRSAADFLNQTIAIDRHFHQAMHDAVAALRGVADFAEMVRLLDEGARGLDHYVDPDVRQFVHIVDNWLISSIAPEVTTLYEKFDLSRRHVERLVKHLYGVPPKMLARKYRALRTAKLLHARNAPTEDYAHAFYDQSHMIREIKHFTGQTPREIRFDMTEFSRTLDARSDLAGEIHPLTALI